MRRMGGLRGEGLGAQDMGTWRSHPLGIARSIWVYPTSFAQPEKQSVTCRQNSNEKFHGLGRISDDCGVRRRIPSTM